METNGRVPIKQQQSMMIESQSTTKQQAANSKTRGHVCCFHLNNEIPLQVGRLQPLLLHYVKLPWKHWLEAYLKSTAAILNLRGWKSQQ